MKMMIISVKDKKVGFGGLHLVVNEELAKRDFSMLFKGESSIYTECPDDFSLYHVGDFDTESGVIDFKIAPEWLYDGKDFVK